MSTTGSWGWTTSPLALRRLAAASVVVNVMIVVTGGIVRLSGSGLGCPTWPSCSGSSIVPTGDVSPHKVIEFTNRTLTFVVGAVLLATFVVAWRQRREWKLAALALAGVPAQAVLGGILVLTDLNPWLVAAHFLLSAAIIAVTFLLWWRVSDHTPVAAPMPAVALARALATVAGFVLVFGTIVTGSGPHAGDVHNGKIRRINISPSGLTQLHADAVMVLVGLTIGAVALAYALRLPATVTRAALLLLGVECVQGAIGYTQYFLDLPVALVAIHMLGACLMWLGALHLLLRLEPRAVRTTG